ncbi:soluble lytic murein transglycosylase-like protein [Roseovarius sp. MBR-154]
MAKGEKNLAHASYMARPAWNGKVSPVADEASGMARRAQAFCPQTHLGAAMPLPSRRLVLGLLLAAPLGACAAPQEVSRSAPSELPLHPNETPELRHLINRYADHYELPRSLVHRLAIRESRHRPGARNGPYYGLLQILPQTARTMGHRGPPEALLDAETNLKYGLKYLRGAYLVADGDPDEAIGWYARGYYYEAKRKGLLVKTGLRSA